MLELSMLVSLEVAPPPLDVVCPPPSELVAVVRPPSELVRVWSLLVVEVTAFEVSLCVLLE